MNSLLPTIFQWNNLKKDIDAEKNNDVAVSRLLKFIEKIPKNAALQDFKKPYENLLKSQFAMWRDNYISHKKEFEPVQM